MHVVQWVFDHGYYGNSDRALEGAAKNGRLDMVEWFVGKWITKGAREAFQAACSEGHVAIVRSIMERKLVQYRISCWSLRYRRISLGCRHLFGPIKLMANAASSGHLHLVKWLIAKFGETATLFPAIDDTRASWVNNTAMDRAASNGHLHVLEFLQSLVDEMQAKGKNEYPTLSNCALSSAAIMGHFEIVKWIRNQYPDLSFESHTTTMIARNGNMEMLKWLQQQPNVEWSTDAIDSAAENGHLTVVKWLYENRSEGCTSAAMDYAARNGHFNVVRWLHHNRSEVGTSAAMDFAASGGYFELMFYLRDQCARKCSGPCLGAAKTARVTARARKHHVSCVGEILRYEVARRSNAPRAGESSEAR